MRRWTVLAFLLALVPSLALAQARPATPPAGTQARPATPPAAAAPAAPTAGAAAFTTAGGLASACEQPAAAGRNFCLGVLFGALNMYNSIADLAYGGVPVLAPAGHAICPPQQVEFTDLRDEFPRWVNARPDTKNLSAARALFFMLAELYPCENSPVLPKRE